MADISEAGKLVGKKVVWVNGKNPHAGRIIGVHGRNGVVKAKFAKGVPGQAIGATVTIVA
jgi:large subunit ribosomal protein L35Ae